MFLFPCYWGYAGGDEGFWKELNANGEAKCREYGRYVGARYRGFTNIVWIHGTDFRRRRIRPAWVMAWRFCTASKRRIRRSCALSRRAFHDGAGSRAVRPFLQLNSVYTGDELGKATVADPYLVALRAYNRPDFKPTFLIEARYENLTGSSYGGQHSKERHRFAGSRTGSCSRRDGTFFWQQSGLGLSTGIG